MEIRTTPAKWPFAMVTVDALQWPCIIVRWERGYPPSPAEWHARVIYVRDGVPRETLALARQITPVGRQG